MKALLVVDLQNDFLPGGSLGVTDGDKVIPVINKIMPLFPIVIASRDWHPEQSVHFDKWPVHCVADSFGAEFPEALESDKIQEVFYKGTDNKDDGYSAFEATNQSLDQFLKDKKVSELYVVGIATDYCVRASALDSLDLDYKTYIVTDAVKPVNLKPEDGENALKELENQGGILINSDKLVNKLS